MRTLLLAATASVTLLWAGAGPADARPTCRGKPATIVGTPGRDTIKLKGGSHVVAARGGGDRIVGGSGRSVVCGGPGDDVVTAGSGADRLFGGPGDDRLHGEIQDDLLVGGPGDDLLTGGHGIDILRGGRGSDWLRADDGTDRYEGGPGDDWISLATATPPGPNEGGVNVALDDRIALGDGAAERVLGIENVLGSAFHDNFRGPKDVNGGTVRGLADPADQCKGFDVIECNEDPRGGAEAIAFVVRAGPEAGLLVLGSDGPDRWRIERVGARVRIAAGSPLAAGPGCAGSGPGALSCAVGPRLGYVVAWGDDEDDRIAFGSRFSGQVYAKLDGGPGDDLLKGAGGSDNLFAGEGGEDVLIGRGGDDALASRIGRDVLRGGRGADQLATSEPCDRHLLDGGSGGPDVAGFGHVRPATHADLGVRARLNGRAFERGIRPCRPTRIRRSEVLEGTEGHDILIGTPFDDFILGRAGNDLLRGLGGDDVLDGAEGRDILFGGRGRDVLRGGPGKDRVRQ